MDNEIMRGRLQKASNQIGVENKERLKKTSKDRLRKVIETKLRNTMIGEIAKVEHFLGKDWGHGLEEKDCSDDQLDKYEVWQQCRDEMLNLGNSQIRAALAELDLYEVEWKGYQTNFRKV